jgi:hypothetical protein
MKEITLFLHNISTYERHFYQHCVGRWRFTTIWFAGFSLSIMFIGIAFRDMNSDA